MQQYEKSCSLQMVFLIKKCKRYDERKKHCTRLVSAAIWDDPNSKWASEWGYSFVAHIAN